MKNLPVERAVTWTQVDIEFVREQRRYWARGEQTQTEKSARKLCQKYVKATTLVLEHMTGRRGGRPEGEPIDREITVPDELYPLVRAVFAFAHTGQTFEEIYGEMV